MSNLQYIGARYVPIVYHNPDDDSAAWKSGESYENLVIVTYLDDSYTSRKPVPASVGDPASNPDYWAKTGDFNAALVTLQNEISNIKNDMKSVALYLGNSIANGTGSLSGHGLFDLTKDLYDEAYNVSGSGTGFVDYDGNHATDTFVTNLQSAITNPAIPTDTVTDLIILGAYGDTRTWAIQNRNLSDARDVFRPAIASIRTLVDTYMPKCKRVIYVNCEGHQENKLQIGVTTYNSDAFELGYVLKELFDPADIIYGGFIGNSIMYNTSAFSSDLYHPNDKGYGILAGCLRAVLTGHLTHIGVKRSWSYYITGLQTLGNEASMLMDVDETNEGQYIRFRYLTLHAGTVYLDGAGISIEFSNTHNALPIITNEWSGKEIDGEIDISGTKYHIGITLTRAYNTYSFKIRTKRGDTINNVSISADYIVPIEISLYQSFY